MEKEEGNRKGFTPADWHWAITYDDIRQIKLNHRETINKVYFANIEKFERIAWSFCFRRDLLDLKEDCVNQIYVDLPKYNYENLSRFYTGIMCSCRIATFIRSSSPCFCNSLDACFEDEKNGRGRSLLDLLTYEDVPEEARKENCEKVFQIIEEQEQLAPWQKDVLTAFAFGCTAYRGLYEYAKRHV